MSATADLLVNVKADTSNAEGALGRMGGGLAGLGKAAVAGAAVATAAIAGVAAKGLMEFAGFDKGMREVFTLMPGISQQAMGAMSDDVLSLSRELGMLPEEIIPALYDSISAGVPADSVFEFLQTAGKASIGGVTDLGTAVDGITSTVNAFGKEAISAGEASDLMFTAVRLGKTTMEELSSSLFQVNPIAAGLGIGFEDVTASLAVLTSQGVPTKVAATQMKSALAELGKSGSIAYESFAQFTEGKTFQQFISEGGNVEQALQIMAKAAKDSGVPITDFFGSIEAGQAAMALTSETGAEAFSKAMDEMQNSAGATDEAFATMDGGMSRSWDKIKANVSTAFIEIGSVLAPFVEQFMDWFVSVLPGALAWFKEAIAAVGPVISDIGRWLGEYVPQAIAIATDAFNLIWPVVSDVFSKVQSAIKTVIGWFSGDDGAGKISTTSSGIISTFQKIYDDVKPIWDQIVEVITVAIELVSKVVSMTLDAIQAIWSTHGEAILSHLSTVWDSVRGLIEGALAIVKGVIDVVMGIITGDWRRVWDGVKGIVSGVWDGIVALVELAISTLGLAIRLGIDAIAAGLSLAWNAIKTTASSIWNGIRDAIVAIVSGFWSRVVQPILTFRSNLISEFTGMVASAAQKVAELPGKIVAFLREIPNRIISTIGNIVSSATQLGKDLVAGIINGMGGLMQGLVDKLKSAIGTAVTKVKNFFGIASPSKVMRDEIGIPLAEGIIGAPTEALDWTRNMARRIPSIASSSPGGAAYGEGGITIQINGNLFGAATVDDLVAILRNRLSVDALAGATTPI